jgi:hypothetical protein
MRTLSLYDLRKDIASADKTLTDQQLDILTALLAAHILEENRVCANSIKNAAGTVAADIIKLRVVKEHEKGF